MKNESDKISYGMEQTMSRQKGKFGKFSNPKKKEKNMDKEICYGCNNFGHYRKDYPNHKRDKEEEYSTDEVKESKTKKHKKEEAKI